MKKLISAVILFAVTILLAGYISYSSMSSSEKTTAENMPLLSMR